MVKPPELSPERQQVITATDSTILMGTVPENWGTPDTVWLDKMGLSKPKKPSLSMFLGHVFEPHIGAHYMALQEQSAYTMSAGPGFMRSIDGLPFGCTPDGVVEDAIGMAGHGFEAKSTTSRADWGKEGTEDIPDRVYIQVQHSMMVTNASRWDVGVFFYDKDDKEAIACHVMQHGALSLDALDRFVIDRKFYKITRNDDVIRQIKDTGMAFWETYVLPKVRPGDRNIIAPDELRRRVKEIDSLDYEGSMQDLITLRREAKDAVEKADALAAVIRATMGDLGTEMLRSGRFIARLTESTRLGKPDFEEAFAVACARGNLTEEAITEILTAYKKPNAVSYRLDVKESK